MEYVITTTKRLTESSLVLERQGRIKVMDAIEIYVLCESRSTELAWRFLNACLPSRKEITNEYPFPQFVDNPVETFLTAKDLMRQLEQDTYESYSIYWNAASNDGPRQAMLFYTEEGEMIAGIGGPNIALNKTLTFIAKQVNGQFGYITSGSCPPDTLEEFKNICCKSTLTNLYDGQLRN